MDIYREESRLRYQRHQALLKEQQQQKEEAEQKVVDEWELEKNQDNNVEEDWYMWCSLLEEDRIGALTELATFIPRMQKEDAQERIILLIKQLNDIQERNPVDAQQANALQTIVSHILKDAGMEIDIELMDTSGDEEMARQLTEFPPPIPDFANLPICSLTRRVGLTLAQLKDLARRYRLPISGNKEKLCVLLAERGLVTIV